MLALAAGPGSRVQRQLCSLLCTLLKAIPAVSVESGDRQQQLWRSAVSAASALLLGATDAKQQQRPAEEAAVAGGTGPAAVSASLPSLFVMGRCCLFKAGQWWAAMGSLNQPATCSRVQEQQTRLALAG